MDTSPLQTPEGRALFQKGLALYREGQYWHAHEAWEDLWRTSPDPERTFLKALIQIAAAMIHIEKGHWRGVRELLERVTQYLAQVPDPMAGLDVRTLRRQVQRTLERVRTLEANPPSRIPFSDLHIALEPLENSPPSPYP